MHILRDAAKVDDNTVDKVKIYLKESRATIPSDTVPGFMGTYEV